MVMAAGRGTRLQPLTDHLPKPMMPVANKPVVEHLFRRIAAAGIEGAIVNLHWYADAIRGHFGDGAAIGLPLAWSYEEELLGTAGGVKRCEPYLRQGGDAFVVASADGLHAVDLRALMDRHLETGATATLTVKRTSRPDLYGVAVLDERERVVDFQEKPPPGSARSDLVNLGIYCFSTEVLDRLPAETFYDFGTQLLPEMAADGVDMVVYETEAYWSDIGSAEELLAANLSAVRGDIDLGLPEDDAALVDPSAHVHAGAELEGRVLVGAGARIEEGAQITGPAVIGPWSTVRARGAVRSGVLLPHATLGEDELLVAGVYGDARRLGDTWAPGP
jgi:mannose-1-phosphate guanylyltransferase/mannose-1-phosphate guanylyltransferase/phosphomannomutase